MRRILRLDMTGGDISYSDLREDWALLGGRGLIDALAEAEINPACHPLSRDNKLIIAPGLFAGTAMPTASRLSFGGKSPLTGGIKEANAGGMPGVYLARLDLAAVVVEGKSLENDPFVLLLNKDGAELIPAGDLKRVGNYDAAAILRHRFGSRAAIISVGPAGEMGQAAASVACTDVDGRPTRHAGRGGMGAVMGSKGLKAVVIDPEGLKPVAGADPKAFASAVKTYVSKLTAADHKFMRTYGTAGITEISSARCGLPTRAYTQGSYDKVEAIGGDRFLELIAERGGKTGHPCMKGCAVRCSNIFHGPDGKFLTAALEYETIALLGANLDIADFDAIAAMDFRCDNYGVDTIETGAALAVLSSTGYFNLGDKDRAIELIDEIGAGTIIGRVLGQGAEITARVFGVDRVPSVKGQAFPGHNARGLKGMGVTYASSPQGADHTAGFTAEKPQAVEGQAELSRAAQIRSMINDAFGLCSFAGLGADYRLIAQLAGPLTGRPIEAAQVREMAWQALLTERRFNRAAGLGRESDRLPLWMTQEPLDPIGAVFDVPDEEIDKVFDETNA